MVVSVFVMCSVIGHTSGCKLCAQNTSKFPKLNYITVAIAMRSITGWCKSVCCNVHERSVTRQAGGGVAIILLKIVKTSHHMALEINEN
jgi:hypothetical protein